MFSQTTSDLSEYLRELAATPFEIGKMDCCLAIAIWLERYRGWDRMSEFHAAYQDGDGWEAYVERHGGLVAIIDRVAERVGRDRTPSPKPGDVGVIEISGKRVAALKTARGWALKVNNGLFVTRLCRPVAAWSV
ncbi:MAG: hypothetical protein AcusKO_29300 [Acuticoccus sp.]